MKKYNLNPLITNIFTEANNILNTIRQEPIKVNKYYSSWVLNNNNLEKVIREPQRILSLSDKTVLALYLSILKTNSPLQKELNDLGLSFEKVTDHLNLDLKKI